MHFRQFQPYATVFLDIQTKKENADNDRLLAIPQQSDTR